MGRRIALWLVWGAIAIAAPPVCAEGIVERKLVEALERATGGKVEIGQLEIAPIDGIVKVDRLSIAQARGVLSRLRAEQLQIALSTWQLIGGELRIRGLTAARLDLELVAQPTGSPDPNREPFDVRWLSELQQLQIAAGSVSYVDEARGLRCSSPSLRVDGSAERGGVDGDFVIEDAQLNWADRPAASIDRLQAQWFWRAPRLEVRSFTLQSAETQARGTLLVSRADGRWVVRSDLSSDLELAHLQPWGLAGEPSGRVAIEAHVQAAIPGDWSVDGKLTKREGPVRFAREELTDLEALFRLDGDRIELREGIVRTSSGASGHVELLSWHGGQLRLRAQLRSPLADWFRRTGTRIPTLEQSSLEAAIVVDGRDAQGFWQGRVSGNLTRSVSAGLAGEFELATAGQRVQARLRGRWGSAPLVANWSGNLRAERELGGWQLTLDTRASRRQESAELFEALRRLGEWRGLDVRRPFHPELDGGLEVELRITGEAARIAHAVAWFEVDRLHFGTVRYERLEGVVERTARSPWRCRARLSDAEGHGVLVDVALPTGRPVQTRITISRAQLALGWWLVQQATGSESPEFDGEFDAEVLGSIGSAPHRLYLVGTGVVTSPWVGTASVRVAGNASFDRFESDHFEFESDAANLQGVLGIALSAFETGPRISTEVSADVRLERLPLAWTIPAVSGTIGLHVGAEYDGLDQPLRVRGEVRTERVDWAGRPIPDAVGVIEARPEGGTVQAAGERYELAAAWRGPLQRAQVSLSGQWRELDLVSLATGPRGAERVAMTAWSDGTIELAGTIGDPEGWSGRGVLHRLDAQGPTLGGAAVNETPFSIDANGSLRIAAETPLSLVGDRGSRLDLHGTLGLFGQRSGQLDLRTEGAIDLGAVEVLHPDLLATGRLACDLQIRGSVVHPVFDGTIVASRGRLRLLPYPESIDGLLVRVRLTAGEARIEQGRFRLGGGEVALSGGLQLRDWLPSNLNLQLQVKQVGLSLPRGVWGRYDGDLQLVGAIEEPEIRGRLEMLTGRYTREFGVGGAQRARFLEPTATTASFWQQVSLDLEIENEAGISVRNELARMQANAALRVTGTLRRPLLTGTVILLEGGRLTFRDNEYEVVSGIVSLDDARGEPVELRLRASTSLRGYAVTLDLNATSESLVYNLTSSPSLPEADILSLLITGQTQGEVGGDSGLFSSEAAATYFGSKLGELLIGNAARRALRVDRFTISPSQVGPEANPTARVTIGRRLDERTLVIYSRDLSQEGRDLYRIERDFSRAWRLTLGREPLGGTAIDARWLHRFGGQDLQLELASRAPHLEDTSISGIPQQLSIKPSDLGLRRDMPLSPGVVTEARDALRRQLVQAGYLESSVVVDLLERPGPYVPNKRRADLKFVAVPGRSWQLRVEAPKKLQKRVLEVIAELWSETGLGTGTFREEQSVLKEALADEGYAAAVVDIEAQRTERRIAIVVDAGPQVVVARTEIVGNSLIEPSVLEQQVLSRPHGLLEGGGKEVYRPRLAAEDGEAIRTLYEDRGYLEAQVRLDERLRSDGSAIELRFTIVPGERWRIGSVRVEGDWPVELGTATSQVPLSPGDWFEPLRLVAAESALRDRLDRAGYGEARVQSRIEPTAGQQLAAVFRIQAGTRRTIRDIRFVGLARTRKRLVDRALRIQEGEPWTQSGIRETERELFRLGLFRRVSLETLPVENKPGMVDLVIQVEEVPRLASLLSFGFDTEEQFRVSGTISNDNLAGVGRNGSLQAFVSSLRRSVRATLEDRHLRRGSWLGLGTLQWQEEERDGFTIETTGLTLQVGSPERRTRRWQLRYQLEDNRFRDVEIDAAALDELLLAGDRRRIDPVRLGAIIGSYVIDQRNDPFLPARGWMARAEFGVWSAALLSEADFLRFTGSITRLVPFGSRWTAVIGGRVGWAQPFGSTTAVPISERFFAGGSDSLRGFERDRVGPVDLERSSPLGGEAVAIFNAELRMRISKSFELVLFGDVGNVWLDTSIDDDAALLLEQSKIGTEPFGSVRTDLGLGLRYRTPVGALRVEYGFNLDPVRGEPSGKFFFSIGEAF